MEEEGYPVISKKVAYMVRTIKTKGSKSWARRLYLTGINSRGEETKRWKLPKKWHRLLDAPFEISEKCCDYLKKYPFNDYQKETGRRPIIGILAVDSDTRKLAYLMHGCNSFKDKAGRSQPLSIWTEQDILQYLIENEINYCKDVYGDIIKNYKGDWQTTKLSRTGCVWCLFGIHMEQKNRGTNRIIDLQKTHPKLYRYFLNQLGGKEIMEYLGIPYEAPPKLWEDE